MANIIKRVWNQNKMVLIEDLKGMAFQAEAEGHTFEISGIDDDGNPVTFSGTPSGVFLRPDNTDVALTCSISGGKIYATFPATCYSVPGRFGLTIYITTDGATTAVYAAIGTVALTTSGTIAPPATDDVVDLINDIATAVASIPASYSSLLADIAPNYSPSALYSVGQYVWQEGDLKRCIVPITVAETYTDAHWVSAVLGNDVADLKSALNATIADLNGKANGSMDLTALVSTNTYSGQAFDIRYLQLVSVTGYITNKYTVQAGNYVQIIGSNPANKYPMYVIFDSSDNVIARMPQDQLSGSTVKRNVIIPENASYMYALGHLVAPTVSIINSVEIDIDKIIETDIESNETIGSKMQGYWYPASELVETDTYDNNIYNTVNGLVSNDSYCVKKYSVSPGQKLKVTGVFASSKNVLYAIFNSSDARIAIPSAEYVSGGEVTLDVIVPENASYMYVTGYHGAQTTIPQKVEACQNITDFETALQRAGTKSLKVEVSSNGVTVTEGLLKLTFGKVGANNLMNFSPNCYWGDTRLFESRTDWIGPYDFLAENNADGDRLDPTKGVVSSNTTGGNHDIHTANYAISTPTARTTEWRAYADGVLLSAGDTVYCSKLRVEWVNRVQAGNTAKLDKDASGYGTGRECLEEHGFAEFTGGGNVNVGVTFIPLEDILMKWYSGLQFAGNAFAPNIYIYEYSNSEMATDTINNYRNGSLVEYVVAEGDLVSLEMYMNRRYGIGKREHDYYYDGQGNKGYFLLFSRDNEDPVHLDEGDHFAWQGHYRFYHTI